MSANAYELLAIAMRYVFAALMLLIVVRAWRITVTDGRRATRLRRLSPQTGIVGEMLVVDGGERARPGMRYNVTLEGTIGASQRADIRVRHSSVRARHAFYQMTDDGLYVRGHAHARVAGGNGRPLRELTLRDGEILCVGRVRLMLVLTGADSAPEEMRRHIQRRQSPEAGADARAARDEPDALFEPREAEDLFMSNPAGAYRRDAADRALDDDDDQRDDYE